MYFSCSVSGNKKLNLKSSGIVTKVFGMRTSLHVTTTQVSHSSCSNTTGVYIGAGNFISGEGACCLDYSLTFSKCECAIF